MDGEQRRKKILKVLSENTKPISATFLAKKLEVSRQVIVQDVALLRAQGCNVLATARGYILNKEVNAMCQRVVLVKHDKEHSEEELNIIIDNGGRVRNVIVIHPVYGEVVADLMLRTRRDIKQFVTKLEQSEAMPLLKLTDGTHMHTIEASNEEELDIIEAELREHGFLISNT
ncbi:transcription repressor NadR [Cellulosilyticum ruminicola]|uniref:transcription repressor NadR n=1 Tax=Cellulosilyticum ruminicola TaxID=425254 RepID=UPI0006D07C23|nr:transcription repressor NadR [Cellulosilyticum ruminicola]